MNIATAGTLTLTAEVTPTTNYAAIQLVGHGAAPSAIVFNAAHDTQASGSFGTSIVIGASSGTVTTSQLFLGDDSTALTSNNVANVVLQADNADIATAQPLGTIGAGDAVTSKDVYIINKTSTPSPIVAAFEALGA